MLKRARKLKIVDLRKETFSLHDVDILESLKSYAAYLSKFTEEDKRNKRVHVEKIIEDLSVQFKEKEIAKITSYEAILLFEAVRQKIIEIKRLGMPYGTINRHQRLYDDLTVGRQLEEFIEIIDKEE